MMSPIEAPTGTATTFGSSRYFKHKRVAPMVITPVINLAVKTDDRIRDLKFTLLPVTRHVTEAAEQAMARSVQMQIFLFAKATPI